MTQKKDLICSLLVLVALLFAAACEEEAGGGDVDVAACETLQMGVNNMSVNATVMPVGNPGPPTIAEDHNRYNVNLPQPGGQGYAFFNSLGGSYVFFLTAPVPISFTDTLGMTVTATGTQSSSPACAEVLSRVSVTFPSDSQSAAYNVKLGPTAVTTVGIAIEEESSAPLAAL